MATIWRLRGRGPARHGQAKAIHSSLFGVFLTLLLAVTAGACASRASEDVAGRAEEAEEVDENMAGPVDIRTGVAFLRGRAVHQPQFAMADDGTTYVVWRETGTRGSNLFISRREDSGVYGPPMMINDLHDSVANVDLDETRVQVGLAGDVVSVAWSDQEGDVRAAISRDRGEA